MFVGYGHSYSGDTDSAIEHFRHGLVNPQITSQPKYKTMLFFGLASVYWHAMNLRDMQRITKQYLAYGQKFNLAEATAVAHCYMGWIQYLKNDLKAAEKSFLTASNTPLTVNLVWQTQAVCGLAGTLAAMGQFKQAGDALSEFQTKLAERNSFLLLNLIKAWQAELALCFGHLAEAIHWAESYDPQPLIGLQLFFVPQFTLVKVWLAQDAPANWDRARNLLAQMVEIAQNAHLQSVQVSILLLQSLLDDRQGDELAALGKLEQAIHLAEPNGIIRLFADLGPSMADLLNRLHEQGVSKRYIKQILKAFPESSAESPTADQAQIFEPLTERELEILGLLARQLSNQEIAEHLVISKGTVKQHTHNIYQKLGVKGRWQAVTEATRLGIIVAILEFKK